MNESKDSLNKSRLSDVDSDATGIIRALQDGMISHEEAAEEILALARVDGIAIRIDRDRKRRCRHAEVIYGQGKMVEDMIPAIERLLKDNEEALVTRIAPEDAAVLVTRFRWSRWNREARIIRIGRDAMPVAPEDIVDNTRPMVAIVSAGSTDIPIAEEAAETLAWMKVPTQCIWDVGVAGPYRLLSHIGIIRKAAAVVVVAGMEGALPSVVGGHVGVPVIAVPTSVGYGASFQGLAALLGMLNSCAANVTVVNIDGGFKGGYIAGLIASGVGVSNTSLV